MLEEYVEKAYLLLKVFPKITPALIMRKFKVTLEAANKICAQVWLRQHKEARAAAAEIDCEWPAQMDSVRSKNLAKFKGKKKKD
jgi:hypothetical protein